MSEDGIYWYEMNMNYVVSAFCPRCQANREFDPDVGVDRWQCRGCGVSFNYWSLGDYRPDPATMRRVKELMDG